jgi:hypothetical protein
LPSAFVSELRDAPEDSVVKEHELCDGRDEQFKHGEVRKPRRAPTPEEAQALEAPDKRIAAQHGRMESMADREGAGDGEAGESTAAAGDDEASRDRALLAMQADAEPLEEERKVTSGVRRNMPDPVPVLVPGRALGRGPPGTATAPGCGTVSRCRQAHAERRRGRRRPCAVGARPDCTGAAVLLAVWLSGVDLAPDEAPAAAILRLSPPARRSRLARH